MNKWEKIASKMAREDVKNLPFLTHVDYNKLKRNYLKLFKECNYDIQKALDFKKTSVIWKSLFY